MTLEQLIAKARGEELTSSEIARCVRLLATKNHPQMTIGSVEIQGNERAAVRLGLDCRLPYFGKTAEDALCAAYDDLERIEAEESAA